MEQLYQSRFTGQEIDRRLALMAGNFLWIRWSNVYPVVEMLDEPGPYIGIYAGESIYPPADPGEYKWYLYRGSDGQPGAKGEQGVQGPKGDQGNTGPANSLSIGTVQGGAAANATITGTAPNQTLNLTLPKGDASTVPGPPGGDGRGIVSVVRTSGTGAPGTIDTYTITFTDETTSTFTVRNGANGEGAGDMLKSVYDVDGDGIVDDAEKLGGQLPAYYAKAADIPDISGKANTADLADVATSGSYGDLDNTPTLGALAAKATVETADITNAAVTSAKLANMAAYTVKGRNASSSGVPSDVTMLDVAEYALFQGTTGTSVEDTEYVPISVSDTSTKKITWENIKATLKTYFDVLYATPAQVDAKQSPPTQLTALPTSGTALTANAEYRVSATVGTYTFAWPASPFEVWLRFTTDATFNMAFPAGTTYIGGAPTFKASTTYEMSVKDSVVIVQEVAAA